MGSLNIEISEDYNTKFEAERDEHFPQLKDTCYLDHAGATLYSKSQIDAIFEELKDNLFSNPHSQSSSSRETSDRIDEARNLVASYFGVCIDDYSVIFTAGCTHSLSLVGQSLSLSPEGSTTNGAFLYLRDCHTSVVGLREVYRGAGVLVRCFDEDHPDFINLLTEVRDEVGEDCRILFALPGQCNFSGHRYSPELVQEVRDTLGEERTLVVLDAAGLAVSGEVDLMDWSLPDLVTVSFYKIFGYPTGLGALLVRRETVGDLLQKDYFGGGTQDAYVPDQNFHRDRSVLHDRICQQPIIRMEDGTVSFIAISALKFGFDALNEYSSEDKWIARHVYSLVEYTRRHMEDLRYSNGAPAVTIYSRNGSSTWKNQGGILAFNVLRSDGSYIGYSQIARMAELYRIQLRVGCFCNIGACQRYIGLSNEDIIDNFEAGHVCGDKMSLIGNRPTGAVRISFGYMSVKQDADRLLQMLRECFVIPSTAVRDSAHTNQKGQVGLKRIAIYPIKSCAPFCPSEWPLSSKGLLFDREWIITDHRGASLTLTQNQRLGRIQPRIDLNEKKMTLSAEGMPDIDVMLETSAESSLDKTPMVKVCNVTLKMVDCGDEVAAWISTTLEQPRCRLLRQNQYRESRSNTGELSLTNECQILLLNKKTVRQLQEYLPENISEEELLQRFRGNFIVDGMPPLQEDKLMSFHIGDQIFKAVGPCARCRIICVNKEKETMTQEPLKTIMKTKSELTFGTYFMRCDTRDAFVNIQQPIAFYFNDV